MSMSQFVKTIANERNLAAPGANTGMLTTALTFARSTTLRITVALTTSSVFNVSVLNGATTNKLGLNKSAALNAADIYAFEMDVESSDIINFEVETDSVIEMLTVRQFIDG